MNKGLKATILVEPEPKGRVRGFVNKKSGRLQFYTPNKTVKTEAAIRAALVDKGYFFEKGIPLYLEATFYLSRPATAPRRITMPAKKPDIDNLMKTLTDALEKFCYANDSQITTAHLLKRYGFPPRIELFIKEDNG